MTVDNAVPDARSSTAARGPSLDAVVSGNVLALRTQRRWRQQDLAVAAGWPRAVVAAIEAGDRRLTLREAAVLCAVLRVPLATLVAGASEASVLGLQVAGTTDPSSAGA